MSEPDLGERERTTLMLMATTIYAARLQAYMASVHDKALKDKWGQHRQRSMEVSITEALKLGEQVRLDFPLPGDALP